MRQWRASPVSSSANLHSLVGRVSAPPAIRRHVIVRREAEQRDIVLPIHTDLGKSASRSHDSRNMPSRIASSVAPILSCPRCAIVPMCRPSAEDAMAETPSEDLGDVIPGVLRYVLVG